MEEAVCSAPDCLCGNCLPQESQNEELQLNISYSNNLNPIIPPQLPISTTQLGTLACIVLSRGKVSKESQSQVPVCENTVQVPVVIIFSSGSEQCNMVTTKTTINIFRTLGYFPHQMCFFFPG